jgi:hypothetical protein
MCRQAGRCHRQRFDGRCLCVCSRRHHRQAPSQGQHPARVRWLCAQLSRRSGGVYVGEGQRRLRAHAPASVDALTDCRYCYCYSPMSQRCPALLCATLDCRILFAAAGLMFLHVLDSQLQETCHLHSCVVPCCVGLGKGRIFFSCSTIQYRYLY